MGAPEAPPTSGAPPPRGGPHRWLVWPALGAVAIAAVLGAVALGQWADSNGGDAAPVSPDARAGHEDHASPPSPAPPLGDLTTPPTFDGPYSGPLDADGVLDACSGSDDRVTCATDELKALLTARGSPMAFDALAQMAAQDDTMNRQSHPVAHALGRHALVVYGTIQATLDDCSYKVFQGCFHGALQAYYEGLDDLNTTVVRQTCPPGTPFEEYTCLHGVGHGLMLATRNDLNRSLELCHALPTYHGQSSCYGGAFMENVVGYMDQRTGAHSHSHGEPVVYDVDPDDVYHPCNAVGEDYRQTCWLMQTSLILFYNGGDFEETARACASLGASLNGTCFMSLGRDASAYASRDPAVVAEHCAYADPRGREQCIRGFAAEVVLNYADPAAGLERCAGLPSVDKDPCYREVGSQGRSMVGADRMGELCATAEDGFEPACRDGAGLPAP